ncbi:hypothetical protein [Rhodococcus phage REQ1]|uniref:hypothetical protein n=1 Tax=Rhodococcus phage REQ1 TaxID=1109712 RepID=UPI00023EEC0A|nr:hypothetical protein RoPhREQ1_gp41 [Rhodococcus phage REQ1]AEV52037.1 hypothetical protein [Rhodococcus phage REQ1]
MGTTKGRARTPKNPDPPLRWARSALVARQGVECRQRLGGEATGRRCRSSRRGCLLDDRLGCRSGSGSRCRGRSRCRSGSSRRDGRAGLDVDLTGRRDVLRRVLLRRVALAGLDAVLGVGHRECTADGQAVATGRTDSRRDCLPHVRAGDVELALAIVVRVVDVALLGEQGDDELHLRLGLVLVPEGRLAGVEVALLRDLRLLLDDAHHRGAGGRERRRLGRTHEEVVGVEAAHVGEPF